MEEKTKIGEVEKYWSKPGVIAVKPTKKLKIGDTISIEGATTNFKQEVKSMQIEHENIEEAKPGDDIGIKVKDRAREGDTIYKITKKA